MQTFMPYVSVLDEDLGKLLLCWVEEKPLLMIGDVYLLV